MMPHMSICRWLQFPISLCCTLIKSTGWLSTVSRRMQPWKALKGFMHSWLFTSTGQPPEERTQRQSTAKQHRGNLSEQCSIMHVLLLPPKKSWLPVVTRKWGLAWAKALSSPSTATVKCPRLETSSTVCHWPSFRAEPEVTHTLYCTQRYCLLISWRLRLEF